MERDAVDVAVVGGGPAGLSAALMLGRMRRSVLVIDDGRPRNAPADAVHGFHSRDGIAPAELRRIGRAEVAGYGVGLVDARVVTARRDETGVDLQLGDGTLVRAGQLVVTTGLTDRLPDLPGLRERWGRDVVHCPYCHGWEVRDQPIGVLNTGPMTAHAAQLFRQLSDRVIVFTHDGPDLTDEQREQLSARGITVVEGLVLGLDVTEDALSGIQLADGRVVPVGALAVSPGFTGNADWLDSLGLEPVEHPSGLGTVIAADESGRTAVPGVWAAGNVTNPMAQVSTSAAAGAWTGAMINMELVQREVAAAVSATTTRAAVAS